VQTLKVMKKMSIFPLCMVAFRDYNMTISYKNCELCYPLKQNSYKQYNNEVDFYFCADGRIMQTMEDRIILIKIIMFCN
jgi:hypothetical protein